MLIGFCGLIGAGKDTAANILVQKHGFVKTSFAAALKDVVAVLFSWDRDMVEGGTPEAREWRETKQDWWSEKFGYDVTPRLMLQKIGTEAMRNVIHNDIWTAAIEARMLRYPYTDFVISDVRFPNEIELITKLGGKVYEIARGVYPEWYYHAVWYNKHYLTTTEFDKYLPEFPHPSEWKWIGHSELDVTISNTGTIEDLEKTISCLLPKKTD